MVTEDDSLSELVDKAKMKEMQREVKILEKRKKNDNFSYVGVSVNFHVFTGKIIINTQNIKQYW